MSSVEGREVHNVSAGKDFTVSICKSDDTHNIKRLGESAGESLGITSYRKIGSSRIDIEARVSAGKEAERANDIEPGQPQFMQTLALNAPQIQQEKPKHQFSYVYAPRRSVGCISRSSTQEKIQIRASIRPSEAYTNPYMARYQTSNDINPMD